MARGKPQAYFRSATRSRSLIITKTYNIKGVFMKIILLSSLCLLLQGCSIIFPAHNNSYDLKGEKVTLTMKTAGELCDLEKELNKGRDQNAKEKPVKIGLNGNACAAEGAEMIAAAPLAAAALSFGMDFVKDRMKEEATHYVAQFGKRKAEQNFWIFKTPQDQDEQGKQKPPAPNLHYAGFEIVRTTEAHSKEDPAFRMVFAFMKSNDGSALMIKPTYVREVSAKAKVLSGWSMASWFNWFTQATGEVEVNVDITIDAIWTDEKNVSHQDRVAIYPLALGNLSLDKPNELDQPDLVDMEGGWFSTVPCSYTPTRNNDSKCGNFWLGVTVTEKDPSNAKKYLETGAQFVSDKKEASVKFVEEKVGKK